MAGRLTHYTTNHDTIRDWAEERGGQPAAVKRTRGGRGKDDPGIIRIDFPGYSGARSLEPISWDEFFDKFDDNDLVLIYQEQTARGQQSNFNKLIKSGSIDTRNVDESQIEVSSRGSARRGPASARGRGRSGSKAASGSRTRSASTDRGSASRGRTESRASTRSRAGGKRPSGSASGSRASGSRSLASSASRGKGTRSRTSSRSR